MNNLDILRNLGDILEALKNSKPLPDSYWIEEQKPMDARDKENKKFNGLIKMSYEKYYEPFII